MTVSGGLQPGESLEESYSDNDGVSIPMTVSGGLQLACRLILSAISSRRFNTDDGIGRATTKYGLWQHSLLAGVSIPMTVSGGLQHCIRQKYRPDQSVVSIPMTVSGGLQRKDDILDLKRIDQFQYR